MTIFMLLGTEFQMACSDYNVRRCDHDSWDSSMSLYDKVHILTPN